MALTAQETVETMKAVRDAPSRLDRATRFGGFEVTATDAVDDALEPLDDAGVD